MAKNYDWEAAKSLYGLGKTDRQIEDDTGIPRATMQRMAKKEGWIKGNLSQAITSGLQYAHELSQKSEPEIRAVQNEVERIAKAKGYIANVAMQAIKATSKAIQAMEDSGEYDLTKLNHGTQALKTAMIPAGVVDYYPPKESKTEININQPKTLDDFYKDYGNP